MQNDEIKLKKKKLIAIVIMLVIMLLCYILIFATFTIIYIGWQGYSVNIDLNNDGKPDINITYGKDKQTPRFNLDINGDGKPDKNMINQDINNDGECDINCDINGDNHPDYNIDLDGDGIPDINIDSNGNKKPDINIDIDGDGIPDINIDVNGDNIPDFNIDDSVDENIWLDTDGDDQKDDIEAETDGIPEGNLINQDNNDDGKCDLNCDLNGDNIPDVNIDMNGDGICDIKCDGINDDEENKDFDALIVVLNTKEVNLHVTPKDMVRDNTREFVEISSDTKISSISLKSNADITRCKYNLIYKTTENSFENKYINDNGNLDLLNDQLILELKGYSTKNNKTTEETYSIDLVKNKNKDYYIGEVMIENDAQNNNQTLHEWQLTLKFRNYRDYNQDNNVGKIILGEVKIEVNSCSRIKKR